jgi:hydroxymethylpyrimidine pyrophosphatase-like HAD family hydrolase
MVPTPPHRGRSASGADEISLVGGPSPVVPAPCIVQDPARGRLRVVGFTDLDGTANDEDVPESERFLTIGPARECIARCQAAGIDVGVVTGRSFGEAILYADALGARGPVICEDGAVIALPTAGDRNGSSAEPWLVKAIRTVSGRQVIINSVTEATLLTKIVEKANLILVSRGFEPFLASTDLLPVMAETDPSRRNDLLERSPFRKMALEQIGYPDPASVLLAAHRLATCFVISSDYCSYDITQGLDERRRILAAVASESGVDVFSPRLPHLRGKDANKFTAINLIDRSSASFWGHDVTGILPVAWGNSDNDLVLMEKLGDLAGIGFMVGQPEHSPSFYERRESLKGADVHIMTKNAGHGMLESLEVLSAGLRQRFGLSLSL